MRRVASARTAARTAPFPPAFHRADRFFRASTTGFHFSGSCFPRISRVFSTFRRPFSTRGDHFSTRTPPVFHAPGVGFPRTLKRSRRSLHSFSARGERVSNALSTDHQHRLLEVPSTIHSFSTMRRRSTALDTAQSLVFRDASTAVDTEHTAFHATIHTLLHRRSAASSTSVSQ